MKKYADRGFLAVNGIELVDLVSASANRNKNLTPKQTMTRNKRNAGYTQGNVDVSLDVELAIEQNKAQVDLALADDDADISAVFECGGERYTVLGVAENTMALSASVGDASKSLGLLGLDIVNENGDSVNVSISL